LADRRQLTSRRSARGERALRREAGGSTLRLEGRGVDRDAKQRRGEGEAPGGEAPNGEPFSEP
jgi:hypothetical protein